MYMVVLHDFYLDSRQMDGPKAHWARFTGCINLAIRQLNSVELFTCLPDQGNPEVVNKNYSITVFLSHLSICRRWVYLSQCDELVKLNRQEESRIWLPEVAEQCSYLSNSCDLRVSSWVSVFHDHVVTANHNFVIANNDSAKRTSMSTFNTFVCFLDSFSQELVVSVFHSCYNDCYPLLC